MSESNDKAALKRGNIVPLNGKAMERGVLQISSDRYELYSDIKYLLGSEDFEHTDAIDCIQYRGNEDISDATSSFGREDTSLETVANIPDNFLIGKPQIYNDPISKLYESKYTRLDNDKSKFIKSALGFHSRPDVISHLDKFNKLLNNEGFSEAKDNYNSAIFEETFKVKLPDSEKKTKVFGIKFQMQNMDEERKYELMNTLDRISIQYTNQD